MNVSSLQYRQTRAAIRDGLSKALDACDRMHASLVHGEVAQAREDARQLALVADDLTALHEQLLRLVDYGTRSAE